MAPDRSKLGFFMNLVSFVFVMMSLVLVAMSYEAPSAGLGSILYASVILGFVITMTAFLMNRKARKSV